MVLGLVEALRGLQRLVAMAFGYLSGRPVRYDAEVLIIDRLAPPSEDQVFQASIFVSIIARPTNVPFTSLTSCA